MADPKWPPFGCYQLMLQTFKEKILEYYFPFKFYYHSKFQHSWSQGKEVCVCVCGGGGGAESRIHPHL